MEEIRNEVNESMETKKSWKENLKGFGSKVKDFAKDKIEYAKENPEEVVQGVVAGATAVGTALLVVAGIKDAKKISRTVYSEDIGECVELNKKLDNDAKKELDYRMSTGQTKIKALTDMGYMK